MHLTETPVLVNWPETHYVYIERSGPFHQTAPEAWGDLHRLLSAISEHNTITDYLSLYRCEPQVYRAGVSLAAPAKNLPDGLEYTIFSGGKYSRFVLMGPFSDLPEASRRVFEIVSQEHIAVAQRFFIEHYVTDPRTTPEAECVTEILVPTA